MRNWEKAENWSWDWDNDEAIIAEHVKHVERLARLLDRKLASDIDWRAMLRKHPHFPDMVSRVKNGVLATIMGDHWVGLDALGIGRSGYAISAYGLSDHPTSSSHWCLLYIAEHADQPRRAHLP